MLLVWVTDEYHVDKMKIRLPNTKPYLALRRRPLVFSFILITGPPAAHREDPGHHIVEMRFHLGPLGLQVSICRSREWFDTTQGHSRQLQ